MKLQGNSPRLYRFCRGVCFYFFRIIWRLEIVGEENVPSSGAAIIAANHRSYADPPLVGVSSKRPVHFLAKKELFSFKPFGYLIARLNAHPLNRVAGASALKEARRLLLEGDVVIVFPEGRRNTSTTLERGKAGVGMLSLMTGAPIVPTYIQNSGELGQFKKVRVIFGPPINPAGFSDYQQLTDAVMAEIQRIKDEI